MPIFLLFPNLDAEDEKRSPATSQAEYVNSQTPPYPPQAPPSPPQTPPSPPHQGNPEYFLPQQLIKHLTQPAVI